MAKIGDESLLGFNAKRRIRNFGNSQTYFLVERTLCAVIGWYRQNKVLWILFSQNGCTNVGSENLGIGPSGVRALSLAAGMNEGGHYGRQI